MFLVWRETSSKPGNRNAVSLSLIQGEQPGEIVR